MKVEERLREISGLLPGAAQEIQLTDLAEEAIALLRECYRVFMEGEVHEEKASGCIICDGKVRRFLDGEP